jgi:plastocyanin
MLTDLWTRLVAWSGGIVAPDWGQLVALIPIILLLVVVAFVVITTLRWASAGPTRRGPGRRLPAGPDGRPLHVPVIGPFVLALGAFALAFGLVAGGPWLPGGIALAAVGLVWWALDLLRPPGAPAAGAGEPRTSTSRRRRTAVRVLAIGVAAVVVVVVAATSRVVPDPSTGAGTLATLPPSAAEPTLPPADVTLAAANVTFVQPALTAPAGRPFTVAFDNRDNVPHNLEIRDGAGRPLFRGDIVTGPKVVVYDVPALPAGQYPFVCTVHPGMTGTLTVK